MSLDDDDDDDDYGMLGYVMETHLPFRFICSGGLWADDNNHGGDVLIFVEDVMVKRRYVDGRMK